MPQRRTALSFLTCIAAGLLVACASDRGQRVDRTYRPQVPHPAFAAGEGPLLCVDDAHHNFHRLRGRFRPFADLARADGFRVQSSSSRFDHGVPDRCRLLVIANAQPNGRDWDDYPYPTPSAFRPSEIEHLSAWVRQGGRLLLIADHMPLAGAAAPLAATFGCSFLDGFAVAGFTTEAQARVNFLRPTIFSVTDGTLRPGPGTSGQSSAQAVTQVASFVGQGFECSPTATPLLVLPADYVALMPLKAWQFTMETPRVPVGGWLQGTVFQVGSGRVAIFGEAAMFTAQFAEDGRPMGLIAPGAEQNARFVLNLLEWLAGP